MYLLTFPKREGINIPDSFTNQTNSYNKEKKRQFNYFVYVFVPLALLGERSIPLLKIMFGRGKDFNLYKVLSRN